MKREAVLLDTSFFLRFLNEDDVLFRHADNYFRFFLENDIAMVISTISIAEYCVGGAMEELPLKNLQILPFNVAHAQKTGIFAKTVFEHRVRLKLKERNIIPNDTKLFAQADCETTIRYYLSSDKESLKIYQLLQIQSAVRFQFLDLHTPCNTSFGLLDFE